MKIYFAGSIRGGREFREVYEQMISILKNYGDVLTEHVGNMNIDGRGEFISNKEIHDRDISWLRNAEVVIAEVTIPSLGVGYELGKATEWHKPVLCVHRCEDQVLSAMIAGSDGVIMRKYTSLADFSSILDEFMLRLPLDRGISEIK